MPMHIVDSTRETPITELMIKVDNKYGKFERNVLAMPYATLVAYLSSGANHQHGNVVASAVTGLIKAAVAGKNGKAADVTKDEVAAYRKAHEGQVKAWNAKAFAESLADADNGDIGVREGGPRLDPVEREYRDLVLARAKLLCKDWRCELPGVAKDGEPAPSIRLADGEVLTRERLFTMIHNSKKPGNGADLRKQAEDIVAARTRVAARGTGKTGETPPTLASVF